MANSKYEYVKSFEVEDQVMPPNLIIVRIDGRDFSRFSEVHDFQRPNDEKALELMNACATSVLEEYPDIVFSYGFSDQYSFIFKKKTKFYQRRASLMKKRAKQVKKLIQRSLLDPEKVDPFPLFLETRGLIYLLYKDSERIHGNTS